NHIPGCMIGLGFSYRLCIQALVVIPVFTLLQIVGIEFPMLVGIGNAFFQPLLLFSAGDMQKELEDGRPGFAQHAFKVAYMRVAALTFPVVYPAMYARDQHIFIMTAVEDGELALRRHLLMHAP